MNFESSLFHKVLVLVDDNTIPFSLVSDHDKSQRGKEACLYKRVTCFAASSLLALTIKKTKTFGTIHLFI